MENQLEIVTLEGKSREEKKVIIAQDVLANIASHKYIAKSGTYTLARNEDGYSIMDNNEDVKANWDKMNNCSVCGVGACLMSITKFNNKLKFSDLPTIIDEWSATHLQLLTEIFTGEELAMIEVMFEGDWNDNTTNWNDNTTNIGRDKLNADLSADIVDSCKNFYADNGNSKDLLTAIMQNIIDNKGEVLTYSKL